MGAGVTRTNTAAGVRTGALMARVRTSFLPGQAGQPACSPKHTGGSFSISQTVFAPLFLRRMTGQQTRSDMLCSSCVVHPPVILLDLGQLSCSPGWTYGREAGEWSRAKARPGVPLGQEPVGLG